MWINVIHYEPHSLSLRPFKYFFQQFHWFSQLQSYFIKWHETERSQKLCIHNVVKCLHFVMLYVKQDKKNTNSWECACSIDWKSSLSLAAVIFVVCLLVCLFTDFAILLSLILLKVLLLSLDYLFIVTCVYQLIEVVLL